MNKNELITAIQVITNAIQSKIILNDPEISYWDLIKKCNKAYKINLEILAKVCDIINFDLLAQILKEDDSSVDYTVR